MERRTSGSGQVDKRASRGQLAVTSSTHTSAWTRGALRFQLSTSWRRSLAGFLPRSKSLKDIAKGGQRAGRRSWASEECRPSRSRPGVTPDDHLASPVLTQASPSAVPRSSSRDSSSKSNPVPTNLHRGCSLAPFEAARAEEPVRRASPRHFSRSTASSSPEWPSISPVSSRVQVGRCQDRQGPRALPRSLGHGCRRSVALIPAARIPRLLPADPHLLPLRGIFQAVGRRCADSGFT